MSKQIVLRPQDVVLAAKLAASSGVFTYAGLSEALKISASEAHASARRLMTSKLATPDPDGAPDIDRAALLEFLVGGGKYAMPPIVGGLTRGVPTAHASPNFAKYFVPDPNDVPPVWPTPQGKVRGYALEPLYPTVPQIALTDEGLYEILSAFDVIRTGAAREREIAVKILSERLR